MSLPRYPEYRDSGLPWLGSLPSHWAQKPMWTLFCRSKRVGHDGEQLLSVYRDFGVVPKASRTDNNNKASDDLSVYQLVKPGDLAINKMKAWQGSVAISEHTGIVSPAYFVYEATHAEDSRYLHYLLRSPRYVAGYLSMSKGIRVNQWDLEPQYHSRMPVALPPKREQQAIAAFLDRETAKIDRLITEQEELIALLGEKRQATISHAVTRGLNPDAPMKHSGVPWLGQVPEHWNVTPLMYLTHRLRPIMYGIVLPGPNVEEGIPIVKGGDVKEHRLKLELLNRTTADIEVSYARARLRPLDIVYSIRGTIGDAEVVPEELLDANITQDVARISPAPGVQTQWLLHVMKSKPVFIQLEQRSLGAAVRGINIFELKRARIPVPPTRERDEIAAFLDAETVKLDVLAGAAERSIALLKERRSALIAAAVTGQIDVRGATAPQAEEEQALAA
jgi:type I restriction enzyme S subunit